MDLESLTAMRSSSEFRLSVLSLFRPKIFSIEIEIKDIKKITGLKSLMTNSRSHDAGSAIFSSPLSSLDFIKYSSYTKMSKSGVKSLAKYVIDIAKEENLDGHANSVTIRVNQRATNGK